MQSAIKQQKKDAATMNKTKQKLKAAFKAHKTPEQV